MIITVLTIMLWTILKIFNSMTIVGPGQYEDYCPILAWTGYLPDIAKHSSPC